MTRLNAPLVAADLEGVFIPEVWIAVADATGIDALRKTTRDIADYDQLMHYRIDILARHGLTLATIQDVITAMEPLPNAPALITWIRARAQFVILTDSFYEFVAPFLPKLGYPTLFAHQLIVDDRGMIQGYRLRLADSKRAAIQAFRTLGFRTMAFGDSYNDTTMLSEADYGVLYRPPASVMVDFPQFPVTTEYTQVQSHITHFLQGHTEAESGAGADISPADISPEAASLPPSTSTLKRA